MSCTILTYPLPDGPLYSVPKEEQPALVFRMAADLLETGMHTADRRQAFIFLVLQGYPSFHVAQLIDDARQYAVQCLVAAEMSDE